LLDRRRIDAMPVLIVRCCRYAAQPVGGDIDRDIPTYTLAGVKTRCACGLPLHYSSEANRDMVQRLIDSAGTEDVIVTATSERPGVQPRHFLVQRHYIALHGLKTQELLKGNIPGAREIDAATMAALDVRTEFDFRKKKH